MGDVILQVRIALLQGNFLRGMQVNPAAVGKAQRAVRAVTAVSYLFLPVEPALVAALDHSIELIRHQVNQGNELQTLSRITAGGHLALFRCQQRLLPPPETPISLVAARTGLA
ncbi:MAG: hypothetical protein H6R25_2867 [Proteobacteria bacterium]|nr:hypothetical protein [Pseudomonadota bacterium]